MCLLLSHSEVGSTHVKVGVGSRKGLWKALYPFPYRTPPHPSLHAGMRYSTGGRLPALVLTACILDGLRQVPSSSWTLLDF